MSHKNGITIAPPRRGIAVSGSNAIGKYLVEFQHAGTTLYQERFDVFSNDESERAIRRYLERAGLQAEKKAIQQLQHEIQKSCIQAENGPKVTFAGIDASELAGYVGQETDWLVEYIFSADQPTIFGAASKATKTTQLIDLAVSLTTETKWLGEFWIPRRRKTLLITGESNYRATSKRIDRALSARSLDWSALAGSLRVEAVDFPTLPSISDQLRIAETIDKYKIEVLIVDPLYRGLGTLDTNRMAEMGSAVVGFAKAVQPASLIISHHTIKSAARELTTPCLEDLSGAGLAESCGNWWLIGRNEPYQFNRIHDLAINFGGRDEQSGIKRIVFDEATWQWEVSSGHDLKEQRESERETRKQQAKDTKLNEAKAGIKHALKNIKTAQPKQWIECRSGAATHITRTAIADLLNDGTLTEMKYESTQGRILIGLILTSEIEARQTRQDSSNCF